MKRAILVSAGTIAGLAAVLSYSGADATVASASTPGGSGAGAGLGGPAPIPSGAPAPSDSAAAPAPSDSAAAPAPSTASPSAAATSAAPSASGSPSKAPSTKPTSAAPSPSKTSAAPKPSPTKTSVAKPTPSPTKSTPKPTPTVAAYKDYLGSVVPDFSYGNMQVEIRVQNGKIIDAWAAMYPKRDPKSQTINEGAIPILRTETIGATSSQIATVAGATLSTNAWIASLQAAMTAAGL